MIRNIDKVCIFIAPKGLGKNIIYSQMLPLLEELNRKGISSRIAVDSSEQQKYKDIDDKVVYSSFKEIGMLKGINLFYTRSMFDFCKLYFWRKMKNSSYTLLYDFRGLISEESFLRHSSSFRYLILKRIEKFIYLKADRVHSVSVKLRNYLIDNYRLREVTVIPCCVTKSNLKENSLNSIIKFVYVGGMSKWQNFDKVVDLYMEISKEIKYSSLTVITLNQKEANRILKSKNIKDVEVHSMSQDEVINELSNYNFGFLLRDDILLNNVASPIKFIEYLSQGVIPILSEGIGDYSTLVKENNIGIVVNKSEKIDIDKIKNLIEDKHIYSRLYEVSNNFLWKNQNYNSFLV